MKRIKNLPSVLKGTRARVASLKGIFGPFKTPFITLFVVFFMLGYYLQVFTILWNP